MTTFVVIKDAGSNNIDIRAINVGPSSQNIFVPTSVPLDQFGNPLFTPSNPSFHAENDLIVSANFTRPANTIAYSSGQLVANNVTAGNVQPMQLLIARIPGGTARCNRARFVKSSLSLTNATFRAHLYKTLPTPVNGDGASYSTDQALGYIGSFTFDMTAANGSIHSFTDGVRSIAVPDVGSEIILDTTSSSEVVYSLLEARAAYTPASAEVFTLSLECKQN